MTQKKGIVLYSGGLDSLLAAKILMDQNIEIIGLHCVLPFVPPDSDLTQLKASALARQIDLPLHFYRCGQEYIDMLKNPLHGYGKNMNPCIDCKIHFIRTAFMLMREMDAQFVATGEVVGQRPMSQMKHMLNHILNETEAHGRLLRPLSAKILTPTIPEQEGIVDRNRLFAFNGRGRKKQMELAEKLGIKEFASPAGGCLFTDPNIAPRVKDLFVHPDSCSAMDFFLLTIGRHFRINPSLKIIVPRDQAENDTLLRYKSYADLYLEPHFKGPDFFIKGAYSEDNITLVARMASRYGKPSPEKNGISLFKGGVKIGEITAQSPIGDDILDRMRIY